MILFPFTGWHLQLMAYGSRSPPQAIITGMGVHGVFPGREEGEAQWAFCAPDHSPVFTLDLISEHESSSAPSAVGCCWKHVLAQAVHSPMGKGRPRM